MGLVTQPLMAVIPVKIIMDNHLTIHNMRDARDIIVVRSGNYEQLSVDHGKVKSDDAMSSPSMMQCHEMVDPARTSNPIFRSFRQSSN